MKIGFARDVRARLTGLQTGSVSELRILDKIPGTKRGEKALHEAFAALRLHHEWFRDREVIEFAVEGARERIYDLAEERAGPHWTPEQEAPNLIYEWVPYDPALLVEQAVSSIEFHEHGRRTGEW